MSKTLVGYTNNLYINKTNTRDLGYLTWTFTKSSSEMMQYESINVELLPNITTFTTTDAYSYIYLYKYNDTATYYSPFTICNAYTESLNTPSYYKYLFHGYSGGYDDGEFTNCFKFVIENNSRMYLSSFINQDNNRSYIKIYKECSVATVKGYIQVKLYGIK